ncbi:hypothetical protein Bhyg_10141 [Pseudolycoriella hygida]|uniref:Uncharacterized protein n=1 Tax=Pseudolycoriella hygida TaxID=35572 RepID=A0A9Q0RYQ9_9DIPT|nr:hypothetical protein Bhyg_10141 [Pseudolycoriella hygida]
MYCLRSKDESNNRVERIRLGLNSTRLITITQASQPPARIFAVMFYRQLHILSLFSTKLKYMSNKSFSNDLLCIRLYKPAYKVFNMLHINAKLMNNMKFPQKLLDT